MESRVVGAPDRAEQAAGGSILPCGNPHSVLVAGRSTGPRHCRIRKFGRSDRTGGALTNNQRNLTSRHTRRGVYGRRVTLIPWPHERWFARVAGVSFPLPFSVDLPFDRVRDQIKNLNRHSPRVLDILESDEVSLLQQGRRICSYCHLSLSVTGWCRRCKLPRG